jgi:hypothetical protein
MKYHLTVDSENKPEEHFLHVLQGSDHGIEALPTQLITSADGGYEGAMVSTAVVMFPSHAGAGKTAITYKTGSAVVTHIITGLVPNTGYDVAIGVGDFLTAYTITTGTMFTTDSAGVLAFDAP